MNHQEEYNLVMDNGAEEYQNKLCQIVSSPNFKDYLAKNLRIKSENIECIKPMFVGFDGSTTVQVYECNNKVKIRKSDVPVVFLGKKFLVKKEDKVKTTRRFDVNIQFDKDCQPVQFKLIMKHSERFIVNTDV